MVFNNLELVSNDLMSRVVNFRDKSGGYTGRTVTQIILTVNNPFGTGKDGLAKWDSTTIPTHTQIKDGKVFSVDSQKLGLTTTDQGYLTFRDGVINFDYVVAFENVTITGVKGDTFVTSSTNLIPYLEQGYDSVIINGKPYAIDLSKPTNGGTVLYTFEPLEANTTSLTFAERSNLKLRNNFRTKQAICAGAKALSGSFRDRIVDKEIALQKIIRNEMASKELFLQEDYDFSDKLLKENVQILNYLGLCN